jgi:hypothetical protein
LLPGKQTAGDGPLTSSNFRDALFWQMTAGSRLPARTVWTSAGRIA